MRQISLILNKLRVSKERTATHMVDDEVRLNKLAQLVAAISLALALAITYRFGANYLRFLHWTSDTHADLVYAVACDTQDGGELSLTVELSAPAIGFRAAIESMEFSLNSSEGHYGYYRIVMPDAVPLSTMEDSEPLRLSFSRHIPPQHWPSLRDSQGPRLEGRLIVRLYLPGREVPTRIPLSGPVLLRGDPL